MSRFVRPTTLILLAVTLFLAACNNAAPVQPPVAQAAATATATVTPTPTGTPTKTSTPQPTNTPTATFTPTPISGAACLPGTWQVEDLSAYLSSLAVPGQVLSESGPVTYRFDEHGQAQVTVNHFAMKVKAPVKGFSLNVNVIIDGEVNAGYTAQQGDQLAFDNVALDGLRVSVNLGKQELFAGTPAETADLFGISLDPLFSTAAYTCRAATLKYTPPFQNARDVVLHRLQ
jgi:hypothetical protein